VTCSSVGCARLPRIVGRPHGARAPHVEHESERCASVLVRSRRQRPTRRCSLEAVCVAVVPYCACLRRAAQTDRGGIGDRAFVVRISPLPVNHGTTSQVLIWLCGSRLAQLPIFPPRDSSSDLQSSGGVVFLPMSALATTFPLSLGCHYFQLPLEADYFHCEPARPAGSRGSVGSPRSGGPASGRLIAGGVRRADRRSRCRLFPPALSPYVPRGGWTRSRMLPMQPRREGEESGKLAWVPRWAPPP